MKIDYEKQLNKQQLICVKTVNSVIHCVGNPGVGKTRVLIYKLHYMIKECGINPKNILVATFTKKAATEMKERLYKIIDEKELADLYIGTFHSLGYRILKHEYMLLDDPMTNFELLSGPPVKWLIKEIL